MTSWLIFGACRKIIGTGAHKNMMTKHDVGPAIVSAARELIERYGKDAAEVARHRATTLSAGGSSRNHDRALLVLSAIENILSAKLSNEETD